MIGNTAARWQHELQVRIPGYDYRLAGPRERRVIRVYKDGKKVGTYATVKDCRAWLFAVTEDRRYLGNGR